MEELVLLRVRVSRRPADPNGLIVTFILLVLIFVFLFVFFVVLLIAYLVTFTLVSGKRGCQQGLWCRGQSGTGALSRAMEV